MSRSKNSLVMFWWSWGPFYAELWRDGVMLWIGRLRFRANLRVWWFRG